MSSVIVRTKEELKSAKNRKCDEIIVKGKLADDLKRLKKISKLGAGAIAALGTAIAAIPFTGGASFAVGLTSVAAFTGLEVSAIILASSLGLALLLAIYKEYDEISYSNGFLQLKRKSKY